MNAQEYLSQAMILNKVIDCKLAQAYEWRCLAEKTTAFIQPDKVMNSKSKSPMEETMIKIILLEHEVNKEIDKLVDLKKEIGDSIKSVEDLTLRSILEYRYLLGRSWYEISKYLDVDLRWTYRLHGKALKAFEESKLI
jgi:DNA-directed RNA polymerase specialized sigma subunit